MSRAEISTPGSPLAPQRPCRPVHGCRWASLVPPVPLETRCEPMPRKVPPLRQPRRQVLPADPGEVIGTFDDNSFGVSLTRRAPPCLRFTHAITDLHARLGSCSHALGLAGWHFTNSGHRQLSGHIPGSFMIDVARLRRWLGHPAIVPRYRWIGSEAYLNRTSQGPPVLPVPSEVAGSLSKEHPRTPRRTAISVVAASHS
jgi:hypothetical protein